MKKLILILVLTCLPISLQAGGCGCLSSLWEYLVTNCCARFGYQKFESKRPVISGPQDVKTVGLAAGRFLGNKLTVEP